MPRLHRNAARPLRALALALLPAALLAACGGSSGSPSTLDAAGKQQAAEQKLETKFADFARCLREHGVNAEAISHPGGGHGLKVMAGSEGPASVEAAERACSRYKPEQQSQADVSPQQKVEMEERLQKFAKCMRAHGVKVELQAGRGVRIQIQPTSGSGLPNPESPAFKRAQGTCQKLLPGGGP